MKCRSEKNAFETTIGEKEVCRVEFDPNYTRVWDNSCSYWTRWEEVNSMFFGLVESYCNMVLKQKGYMFLNDVYEELGLSETKAGAVVGWIYDLNNPLGDNHIEFDIVYDQDAELYIIDFNVDGMILDRIN